MPIFLGQITNNQTSKLFSTAIQILFLHQKPRGGRLCQLDRLVPNKFFDISASLTSEKIKSNCFESKKYFEADKIMSCEIKLRCANMKTIYVSRIQNQTVSYVILQVDMYMQSKSWKYKFIHCLPPIFARNNDFSKNYLFYKENYPEFKKIFG